MCWAIFLDGVFTGLSLVTGRWGVCSFRGDSVVVCLSVPGQKGLVSTACCTPCSVGGSRAHGRLQ